MVLRILQIYPSRNRESRCQMSQRLTQRSDIQSLRALAILLVVGAHTQVPYLQGGYVGVS